MAKISRKTADNGDHEDVNGVEEAPVEAAAAPAGWQPPDADCEFVFEDVASLPGWADKAWAGPPGVLYVPAMDYPAKGETMRQQAYHTAVANKGDTVKWVEKKRRFVVEPAEPEAA